MIADNIFGLKFPFVAGYFSTSEIPNLHQITLLIEQMKYADAPADTPRMQEAIASIRRALENIL